MIKRLTDIAISAFGLLLLSPLLLVVAAIVKFYDGGSIFFMQVRVGRLGIPFRMFKFRSMVTDAEKGAALTVGKDRRITPVGHFLRRSKLDELPQLWNVLRGEMSLVGPRPEIAKFVDGYTPEQRRVLNLKPGITDPASFAFYDESQLLSTKADPERFYKEQLMNEKIRINLDYAQRAWLGSDLLLILATLARMFGIRLDIFSWLKMDSPNLKAGL